MRLLIEFITLLRVECLVQLRRILPLVTRIAIVHSLMSSAIAIVSSPISMMISAIMWFCEQAVDLLIEGASISDTEQLCRYSLLVKTHSLECTHLNDYCS